jgi:hypothetical protein
LLEERPPRIPGKETCTESQFFFFIDMENSFSTETVQ